MLIWYHCDILFFSRKFFCIFVPYSSKIYFAIALYIITFLECHYLALISPFYFTWITNWTYLNIKYIYLSNKFGYPFMLSSVPLTRTYFVDHLTRKTSWERPQPLPSGWDRRLDSRTGRVYFVDHRNRKTYWRLPASFSNPSAVQSENTGSSNSTSVPVHQSDLPSYSVENATPASDSTASAIGQLERLSTAAHSDHLPTREQPGEPSASSTSSRSSSAINALLPPIPASAEPASQPASSFSSVVTSASAAANQTAPTGSATPPRPPRGDSASTKTTPTRSRAAPASGRSAPLEPDPMDEVLGPLPPEWERRIAPNSGARYFVNHRVCASLII